MSRSYLNGAAYLRCIAGRAPVNICRLVLLLTLVNLEVKASSDSPPRVASCRIIYKSKDDHVYEIPAAWGACERFIFFKTSDEAAINLTDTRNCENFYQCQGYSCQQCPCPIGQKFNPKTLRCDNSQSECVCPIFKETAVTKVTSITAPSTDQSEAHGKAVPDAVSSVSPTSSPPSSGGQQTSPADGKQDELSTEVIIITAIVSVTVIIIVVIVMAVFLWQKTRNRNRRPVGKPSPVRTDGYMSAGPPSEAHVYAEIGESTISSKPSQNGGKQGAPAPPDNLLPKFKLFSPCLMHSHCEIAIGAVNNGFTGDYPTRSCLHGHWTDSNSPRYVQNSPVTSHCCHGKLHPTSEGSNLSSESQYSTTGQQTSIGSHDISPPLLHPSCRQAFNTVIL